MTNEESGGTLTEKLKSKNDYFYELEQQLKPKIDLVLNHSFINKVSNALLTRDQLKKFAIQYNIYCSYFPRFLAAAASQITDDQIRLPIVANLWEEHGSGDLLKSHRVLFKNFMSSLGIPDRKVSLKDATESTKHCVESLFHLCCQEDFLTSLGALGPGTEFFTSPEYTLIANGLKKCNFLDPSDVEFWTIHIELDNNHYSDILESLTPYITDPQNCKKIKDGALFAINLEIEFWDGMELHCA